MRLALAAIVLLAALPVRAAVEFLSEDAPEPEPSEIVGTLYGKTYRFVELGQARTQVHATTESAAPAGRHIVTALGSTPQLRMGAASRLHDLALKEGMKRLTPGCELSVSDGEIAQFVTWWRAELRRIESEVIPWRKPNPGIVYTGTELSSRNPYVAQWSLERISEWKSHACVYRAFKGGHVQRTLQGNRSAWGAVVGGYLTPAIHPGRPIGAYLALFARMEASGDLAFAEKRYRDAFYWRYEFQRLEMYPPAREEEIMLVPYWSARS